MIKSDLYSKLNISRVDTRSTNTYRYNDFFFDIVTIIYPEEVKFDAYLYHEDYGIKDLMFGVSGNDISYEEFLITVVGNIDEYIEGFNSEYFD